VKNWLKALLAETFFSVVWILSALSTLSTFFIHSLSGRPRLVSAAAAILGFAWANFRVFRKQELMIAGLAQAASLHEARTSQLTITPGEGSRYILKPVSNVPHADFNAMYLEFHLMIENTGQKNSTITNFSVEVRELGKRFDNLRSIEGKQGVQGRHCVQGLNPKSILSNAELIRIAAESATGRGTLLFFIPGVNLQMFVQSGLRMTGEQHTLPSLHCLLTVMDRNQSSATAEFELPEA
jgi:hypothetical protein